MDIEALFVKDGYRGQGIGKSLIQYLETTFIVRGIYHFHNGAYLSNLKALSLYASMGYRCNGEVVLEKSVQRVPE
jgi:GNAT superfamily N-acetyltransferase